MDSSIVCPYEGTSLKRVNSFKKPASKKISFFSKVLQRSSGFNENVTEENSDD